jgi:Tol biopolymer transport system component
MRASYPFAPHQRHRYDRKTVRPRGGRGGTSFGEGFSRGLLIVALAWVGVAGGVRSVAAASTTRVSVDSTGLEANAASRAPSISKNGRYVAFSSRASNLVAGDTNGVGDIFVHDRKSGATTRVSVDSAGAEANGESLQPSISADGRFVAFTSAATNLVPGDTNNVNDVFVHDRQTGATTRASVDSMGAQADRFSGTPEMSANGRFVAFQSNASNLVPGDTSGFFDIFVHDLTSGRTTRVSVDSAGVQANNSSSNPSISKDGRFVAFSSLASNLVPGDTNTRSDIFLHDLTTGTTTRASVNSADGQGNGDSDTPSISADGRFVAFTSAATNLVPADTNARSDIFVHDLTTGTTTRASVDSTGAEADGNSLEPSISADGRFVAFSSLATNLVPGDTNGVSGIFVHDRTSGGTTRASVKSSGAEANGDSFEPSISGSGRFVAFSSPATNLVPGDTNGVFDVFLHHLK